LRHVFIKIVSEDSRLYRREMNDINILISLLKVPRCGIIRTNVLSQKEVK
jgi:hypothetical protein